MSKRIAIVVVFIFSLSLWLEGQNSRSNLEAKRKSLSKEIDNTAKMLNQTTRTRQHNVQELLTLQKQVSSREELIQIIRQELDTIETQLQSKQSSVQEMETELLRMKNSYKKILIQLYRHSTTNKAALLLFSAASFSKAYSREYYLSQLEKRRSEQAIKIRKTKATVDSEIAELKKQRNEKSTLLGEELSQKNSLHQELSEKDLMVRSLKSKETQLRKELTEKERSKKQLNSKIENVIREQIAAAKSSTRTYQGTSSNNNTSTTVIPTKPNASYIPSTNDNKDDENSFVAKKGRMPAPVKGGIIVSKFGKQQHPLFEQVITQNNGIDIRTGANATVKAVHSGTVVSVFAVPGSGNAVMLKHGNYYTTYSNLAGISVKRGDKVATGDALGTVGKDINSGNYLLHFELWNGKNKENPELWVR